MRLRQLGTVLVDEQRDDAVLHLGTRRLDGIVIVDPEAPGEEGAQQAERLSARIEALQHELAERTNEAAASAAPSSSAKRGTMPCSIFRRAASMLSSSAIWKRQAMMSRKSPKGWPCVCGVARPRKRKKLSGRASLQAANSWSNRLLPMPASATTLTAARWRSMNSRLKAS